MGFEENQAKTWIAGRLVLGNERAVDEELAREVVAQICADGRLRQNVAVFFREELLDLDRSLRCSWSFLLRSSTEDRNVRGDQHGDDHDRYSHRMLGPFQHHRANLPGLIRCNRTGSRTHIGVSARAAAGPATTVGACLAALSVTSRGASSRIAICCRARSEPARADVSTPRRTLASAVVSP